VLPSGEVICGPCVRRAWDWLSKHGERKYRVGPKGKGSKYVAFPTGITKKNGPGNMAVLVFDNRRFGGGFAVTASVGKKEAGQLLTVKVPYRPLFMVRHIEVRENLRRAGIGTALYEAAAVEAERRGGRLASLERFSAESEGFWQKQIRKGRAVTIKGSGSWGRWGPAQDILVLRPGVRDLKNNRRTSRRRTSRR
jgi:GNAT superfamily N-acetyltransferase